MIPASMLIVLDSPVSLQHRSNLQSRFDTNNLRQKKDIFWLVYFSRLLNDVPKFVDVKR